MAKLDPNGRVYSSGKGVSGLYVSWYLFQQWLGVDLPLLRARLARIVK